MNAPLTSTSFPNGAGTDRSEADVRANRANSLSRAIFSRPGISDADLADEHRAQRKFFAALAVFKSEAQDCAALSDLMKVEIEEMLSALRDYAPSGECWDTKIMEARNG